MPTTETLMQVWKDDKNNILLRVNALVQGWSWCLKRIQIKVEIPDERDKIFVSSLLISRWVCQPSN